jgi:DNA-binding NarL/FixJ family response regulator
MEKTINILVTSRHEEDCKNILSILESQRNFNIVGVEKDEYGTITKVEKIKPDILILDLQSPVVTGDKLALMIHRRSPSTGIIFLCNKDEEIYASISQRTDITGFMLKEADMDKLVSIINIVYSGGYYVSASITTRIFNAVKLINQFPGQVIKQEASRLLLTAMERSIVIDMAQGLSDKEIAKHLNISTGTIRNYLTVIKHKTNLKNRIQIVIFSLVCGIINFEQLNIWDNRENIEVSK